MNFLRIKDQAVFLVEDIVAIVINYKSLTLEIYLSKKTNPVLFTGYSSIEKVKEDFNTTADAWQEALKTLT